MSAIKILYQTVLRRPSRFFVVVAVTSLFFERSIDVGVGNIFDSLNRGVSKIKLATNYYLVDSLNSLYVSTPNLVLI